MCPTGSRGGEGGKGAGGRLAGGGLGDGLATVAVPPLHVADCRTINVHAQAVEVANAAKGQAGAELAVDTDLLLGRVYSAWKGHTADALALYDRLAEVRTRPHWRKICGLAAG